MRSWGLGGPLTVLAAGIPRSDAVRDLYMLRDAIHRDRGFGEFYAVERFFNVHYEDLVAHRPDALPPNRETWHKFVEDAQQDIRQFLAHVSGGRVYHVVVHGPSSLAMGVGAVLGTRTPVVGYQLMDGTYRPVLDVSADPRVVKSPIPTEAHRYIQVTWPAALSEDVAVFLHLASHSPLGAAQRHVARHGPSWALVSVANTYGGNLTDPDWTPVVRELFHAFSVLQGDPAVRRIHVFHSMPTALALGLGMALGPFVPVTVYNYERRDDAYAPVLDLTQLRTLM